MGSEERACSKAWGQVFDFEFRLFKLKDLILWILNEYLRAIKNPMTHRVTGFKYIWQRVQDLTGPRRSTSFGVCLEWCNDFNGQDLARASCPRPCGPRCAATAKPQCTWMCRCREAQDVRERPPGELVNLYYGSNPPQFPMDKKMAPLLGARGAIFLSIGNW